MRVEERSHRLGSTWKVMLTITRNLRLVTTANTVSTPAFRRQERMMERTGHVSQVTRELISEAMENVAISLAIDLGYESVYNEGAEDWCPLTMISGM
jgi:hypothetical protein